MSATIKKILVIGGTGLLGSSICRIALNRGYKVVSLTRSGKPFKTSEGHSPPWVSKVEWHKGTPFSPSTYSHLLPECTAVVSTLGILLETMYKEENQNQVNPFGVLKGLTENLLGRSGDRDRGNPLMRGVSRKEGEEEITYERINRDAALAIYDTFASTPPTIPSITSSPSTVSSPTPIKPIRTPSPFIYISAEDIFRPFIPTRYISTKREAERLLKVRDLECEADETKRLMKTIVIRPSLIYHPHLSPISTLPATVLSLSASIQSRLPTPLRISHHFPSPSPVEGEIPHPSVSLSNLLTIQPIHSDTIAESVLKAIEGVTRLDSHLIGERVEEGEWQGEDILGVKEMRRMVGFRD